MPGYIKKQLKKMNTTEKKHSKATQDPLPEDTTERISKDKIKQVQKVMRSVIYYARTIDITLLMALRTVAAEQSKTTEFIIGKVKQFWITVQLIQMLRSDTRNQYNPF